VITKAGPANAGERADNRASDDKWRSASSPASSANATEKTAAVMPVVDPTRTTNSNT
jgi:hypothetical protein